MEIGKKKKTLTTTSDHISQMEIISVFVLVWFSLDVTNYPEI